MTTKHAKNRAPSAAKRWLSCPQSALITPMYPNDESDASLKGDYEHSVMEDTLTWGVVPSDVSHDLTEYMLDLLAYVKERKEWHGPSVRVFVEQELDIPETGEFGTADIILVSDKGIEVIDYKSGYVAVDVKMNAQMLTYLLGVIGKHGERKYYRVSVYQPYFDHVDGPLRHFEPKEDDIEWFRKEIAYSMANEDECKAGKHCKETYCPHRGACQPFREYIARDLALGWFPSEVRGMPDDDLAKALDDSEVLAGYRSELRGEAMRRIVNMGRHIGGFKVVKGKRQRAVTKPYELVHAVHDDLGCKWAISLFPDLSPYLSSLSFPMAKDDGALKFLGTPKHIEDVIKEYAKQHNLPRGGWKAIYDNVVAKYIRDTVGGLTLEKAIDGREAYKRGSEFSAVASTPASIQDVTII